MGIRINKYLAERGMCSGREADGKIRAGEIWVNGEPAKMGMLIESGDKVTLDGEPVRKKPPALAYYAFHKPVGIMTSVDPKAKDTVRSFLGLEHELFPVGRLDVASSGLLLLTNDGRLSERITHPKYDHEKEYVVKLNRPLSENDRYRMEDGMMILGSKTKPARIFQLTEKKFSIILTEGRNRQIRRMCEQLGYLVVGLRRIRVMNIELEGLRVGAVRPLTTSEIKELKTLLEIE